MILQALSHDPLAQFNNYPAIDPQINAFPKAKKLNPSKACLRLSPSNQTSPREVAHSNACGQLKSNDFGVFSSQMSPNKLQLQTVPSVQSTAARQIGSPNLKTSLAPAQSLHLQNIPRNLP